MKVTYIYHSGFMVELDSCILIFDYYKENIPAIPNGKPVYFFASHKHQDHFNMHILNMLPECAPTYILSNDIRLSEKYLERYGYDFNIKKQIVSAKKNDDFMVDNIRVRTLKSTDQGCAFVVSADGKNIYHAGDLNTWVWAEAADDVNERQLILYKEELGKIKDVELDAAFVPLDPRLVDNYAMGLEMFLDIVKVKSIFPMHMWDQYDIIQKAKKREKIAPYKDLIRDVSMSGEEWIL